MMHTFRTAAAALLVFGFSLSAIGADVPATDAPPATNTLERMHVKNANCVWTREIGDHIYQCLKENFGMNAHWCHNEAMDLLCPKQEAAKAEGQAKQN